MQQYITRRLLLAVATLIGVSWLIFFIQWIIPGDVAIAMLGDGVAYLLAADIVSKLPSFRLSDDNQSVIMTRNRFSTPRSSLLACIGAYASRSTPRSSTGILF